MSLVFGPSAFIQFPILQCPLCVRVRVEPSQKGCLMRIGAEALPKYQLLPKAFHIIKELVVFILHQSNRCQSRTTGMYVYMYVM